MIVFTREPQVERMSGKQGRLMLVADTYRNPEVCLAVLEESVAAYKDPESTGGIMCSGTASEMLQAPPEKEAS